MKGNISHRYLYLAAAILFVLTPELASAAAPAKGGPPPGIESLLWPTANFILYSWLLITIYRKKLRPMLQMRSRSVAERIQKATSVLADADEELSNVQARLEAISDEQEEIISQLEEEGQNIAVEVLRNAERAAEAIRNDISRRINREVQQAKAEIRAEVVRQATNQARGSLEQTLSADDDQRLRQEALQVLL